MIDPEQRLADRQQLSGGGGRALPWLDRRLPPGERDRKFAEFLGLVAAGWLFWYGFSRALAAWYWCAAIAAAGGWITAKGLVGVPWVIRPLRQLVTLGIWGLLLAAAYFLIEIARG